LKKIATYFLLSLLFFASCKSEKKTTASHAGTSENAEPEALRPQVDLRFQEKFFEAQKQKALGNIDLAHKAFVECLNIEPLNGAVNYELARIEANVYQSINRAVELAVVAVKSDTENPWYHKLLGDLYMELLKADLAIKEYKEVLRLQPGSNAESDLVYALVSAGKTKEAIALYDANEKKYGVSEETALQKHQLYLQLEDYDKAGLELEKLAQAFPKNADYWGMVIGYYQDIGKPEKARTALEELKKCDVENGRLHLQLSEYYAYTFEDQKSFDELILAFESYDVLIDEKIAVLMRFFVAPKSDTWANERTYRLLNILTEKHATEAKAFSMYGDFLYRDERYTEAAVKYRKAVQLDPSRHVIWAQLLDIEQRSQDFDSMKSESASALELFPGMPEFYLYNGLANIRLGNTEEALESLSIGKELVIEDNSMLSRFHALLGDVYHHKKQHEKSDEQLEQAIKLSPDNLGFLNNYAYYLALRKTKLDKAAEMSKMCVTREPSNSTFQDTYAWVLFKQGKFPESLSWMEKSIQATAMPEGEQLEHYGDILFMNGRAADALVQWKKALPLSGVSAELKDKIAQQKIIE
jgi:tetratricopeptide (TPR) repeat protein